jgi:hypothetical protein
VAWPLGTPSASRSGRPRPLRHPKGRLLLACFLAGLVTSNTAIALASAFGFLHAASNFKVYATVSVVAASFSLLLGLLFLLGASGLLPAIFSG